MIQYAMFSSPTRIGDSDGIENERYNTTRKRRKTMMTTAEIIAMCNKKAEEQKVAARFEHYRRFGFNEHGVTYIAFENVNTTELQQEFRSKGGFYDKVLGWHANHWIEGFRMKACRFDDVCINRNGRWFTQKYLVDKIRRECATKHLCKRDATSEFVGEVRQDINVRVRLVKMYETAFRNPNYEYGGTEKKWDMVFKDANGNIFKFTTSWYDHDKVVEFCGKAWLNVTAKVICHVDGFGRKETKIGYPTIMRGKRFLKDYARMTSKELEKNLNDSEVEEREIA